MECTLATETPSSAVQTMRRKNFVKSEEEIYDFLISKYGEWIVYQPTFTKNNLLLWTLPYLAFILGGVIIFLLFKKNRNNKAN